MKITTRKRKLALFVAIIMALTVWMGLPLTASADVETVGDIEYTYTVSNNEATITGVNKKAVTGEVEIPSTLGSKPVVAIGNYVFQDCTSLESVIIPNSVISIGGNALRGCSSLVSVSIPDSVISIGAAAFRGCTSLTSMSLSKNVTTIGIEAFIDCNSLTAIEVAAENANYSSVEGVLFNKAKTTLIAYPAGNTRTNYTTIPDSVTIIGYTAFVACNFLEFVTIPDGVTTVDSFAFLGCASLKSVTIPDSVQSIGMQAFGNCASLESITIPDGVASIGSYTFVGCSSLASITIPESVTSIGGSAFQSCPSLEYVIIPEGVTSIGGNAFGGSTDAVVYVYEGSAAETYVENNPYTPSVTVPAGGSVEGDENGNIIFTLPGGGSVTTPPGAQVAAGEGGAIEVTLPCEDGGDITIIAAPGSTVTTDGSVTALGGTPLVLTAGTVNRTSNTAATARFTSSAAGTYYYAVVEEGAGVPSVDTSGAGTACVAATQTTISLSGLTAGVKDLYLIVKDTDGNMSPATFKIAIPAYTPPPPPPTTYAVTVGNGLAGNATYEAGATVNITANAPASGKIFDTWTSEDGVTFASAASATTSFVMPAKAVTVTAMYKDDPNAGGDDPNPPAGDNGWVYEDGTWKFYTDGEAATGWLYDDDAWYYLNASGEMQTGWMYDTDYKAWFYFAGNGAMKTGWVKDNGNWYYLSGNGAMVAAKWLHDADGSWYYLSGNGTMLTGKQNIGGKTYTFKANGVWVG